jgi:hypothetical protein
MKPIRLLPAILSLVLGMLINQPAITAEPIESNQLQNQGSSRAYIDPNTGQLTSSPTPQQALEPLLLSPEEHLP